MHIRSALLALAIALLVPASAQAQVFYDDDDSGGKEYAIPTDDARKQGGANASGNEGGGGNGGGSGSAGVTDSSSGGGDRVGDPVDAFGAGISKSEGDDSASKGSNSSAGGGVGDGAQIPGAPDPSATTLPVSDSDDGGSSTLLWTVLFPLGTLLLAIALFLLLSRRRDSTKRPTFSTARSK